ncbi:MAG TPA: hypothetical protein VF120_00325 [Ktedonobacterales bacterium]
MAAVQHAYDPAKADSRVQEIISALITSHQQHGKSADAQQEALTRRQLRFLNVGGKHLSAAYIDSALAYARKTAESKNEGKPSADHE